MLEMGGFEFNSVEGAVLGNAPNIFPQKIVIVCNVGQGKDHVWLDLMLASSKGPLLLWLNFNLRSSKTLLTPQLVIATYFNH